VGVVSIGCGDEEMEVEKMRRESIFVVAAGVATLVSFCPCAFGDFGASIQWLGFWPGDPLYSEAYAASADGSVVVGSSGAGWRPLRWTAADGMTSLGGLPGGSSAGGASDVSGDGSVVVGWSQQVRGSAVWEEAFRWTATDGMIGLGYLPGGGFVSNATGVSDNGEVVVGVSSVLSGSSRLEAFRWTATDGMVGLGDFAGGELISSASDVSGDGSVVVGYSMSTHGKEPFRWTLDDGMTRLSGVPGSLFGTALATSGDGSVVVGYSQSNPYGAGEEEWVEAFRWTLEDGIKLLGHIDGSVRSVATDVSGDGSIVVGNDNGRPIIWDEVHGMRLLQDVLTSEYGLDLTGYSLREALGISADGRTIVGSAWKGVDELEAFVV